MEVSRIISEIDSQILKLQQARALLAESSTPPAVRVGRGRPKGSKNAVTKTVAKTVAKVGAKAKTKAPAKTKAATKRSLTPEGRKRIADAMKKRWEERRKQASR